MARSKPSTTPKKAKKETKKDTGDMPRWRDDPAEGLARARSDVRKTFKNNPAHMALPEDQQQNIVDAALRHTNATYTYTGNYPSLARYPNGPPKTKKTKKAKKAKKANEPKEPKGVNKAK